MSGAVWVMYISIVYEVFLRKGCQAGSLGGGLQLRGAVTIFWIVLIFFLTCLPNSIYRWYLRCLWKWRSRQKTSLCTASCTSWTTRAFFLASPQTHKGFSRSRPICSKPPTVSSTLWSTSSGWNGSRQLCSSDFGRGRPAEDSMWRQWIWNLTEHDYCFWNSFVNFFVNIFLRTYMQL